MSTDIKGALQQGRLFLRQAGIETAALDAGVLLAVVLGKDRDFLLREPGFCLGPAEYRRYRELLQRRARGEPVAYLAGSKEFMGLDFKVDRRVLIPRPETELLVETALVLLGGPAPPEGTSLSLPPAPGTGVAADAGTGSGAIAVSLAHYLPGLRVLATDISPGALEVAAENARQHGVAHRVHFRQGDLLEPLEQENRLSLVAANLPYVPSGEMGALPRTVKNYEPGHALDGGLDGLDCYRRLLSRAGDFLAPGGYILAEIAPGQGDLMRELAPRGWAVQVLDDPGGKERLVIFRCGT